MQLLIFYAGDKGGSGSGRSGSKTTGASSGPSGSKKDGGTSSGSSTAGKGDTTIGTDKDGPYGYTPDGKSFFTDHKGNRVEGDPKEVSAHLKATGFSKEAAELDAAHAKLNDPKATDEEKQKARSDIANVVGNSSIAKALGESLAAEKQKAIAEQNASIDKQIEELSGGPLGIKTLKNKKEIDKLQLEKSIMNAEDRAELAANAFSDAVKGITEADKGLAVSKALANMMEAGLSPEAAAQGLLAHAINSGVNEESLGSYVEGISKIASTINPVTDTALSILGTVATSPAGGAGLSALKGLMNAPNPKDLNMTTLVKEIGALAPLLGLKGKGIDTTGITAAMRAPTPTPTPTPTAIPTAIPTATPTPTVSTKSPNPSGSPVSGSPEATPGIIGSSITKSPDLSSFGSISIVNPALGHSDNKVKDYLSNVKDTGNKITQGYEDIKKLDPNAQLPSYAHQNKWDNSAFNRSSDIGYDNSGYSLDKTKDDYIEFGYDPNKANFTGDKWNQGMEEYSNDVVSDEQLKTFIKASPKFDKSLTSIMIGKMR